MHPSKNVPDLLSRMSFCEVIAYLAGIVDGEGCFCIRQPGGRQAHGYALFSLANTAEEMVMTFARALDDLQIHNNIRYAPARGNRQPIWMLTINRHDDLERFCGLLQEKLLVKYEQCRLTKLFVGCRKANKVGAETVDEMFYIAQVRALNNGGSKKQKTFDV